MVSSSPLIPHVTGGLRFTLQDGGRCLALDGGSGIADNGLGVVLEGGARLIVQLGGGGFRCRDGGKDREEEKAGLHCCCVVCW